jgi:DNA-binding NarL/FixJ family response regulator
VTEIPEILRRLQLGERARRIARELGVSRSTVAHYRRRAAMHGLLTGPLPEPAPR